MIMDRLTIKDCSKNYGISEVTLRRWIKKGKLKAMLIDGQYMIAQEDIEKIILIDKKDTEKSLSVDEEEPSTNKDINALLDDTRKENEMLTARIRELERELEFQKTLISRLEEDKAFLQGQIQQLTNTLNLLTTKQLPPPPGFFDRIKSIFRKEGK